MSTDDAYDSLSDREKLETLQARFALTAENLIRCAFNLKAVKVNETDQHETKQLEKELEQYDNERYKIRDEIKRIYDRMQLEDVKKLSDEDFNFDSDEPCDQDSVVEKKKPEKKKTDKKEEPKKSAKKKVIIDEEIVNEHVNKANDEPKESKKKKTASKKEVVIEEPEVEEPKESKKKKTASKK